MIQCLNTVPPDNFMPGILSLCILIVSIDKLIKLFINVRIQCLNTVPPDNFMPGILSLCILIISINN